MMLSRVANCLYWMGRYVERAENICRLVLVTTEITAEAEGLDERIAQEEWDTLLHAVPGSDASRLEFSPASGLGVPYIGALLLDADNPASVYHSIERARENARVTREAISREVFQNLNLAYRELDGLRRKRVTNPTMALEAVQNTHRAILTTVGAMEHTLSHDQGWYFIRLGEALERTLRTVTVLRAKLSHFTEDGGEVALPLIYARRRGLLRSLSCLEAFRRAHGASLGPDRLMRFLAFDPEAPRSIRAGVSSIVEYLDKLPEGVEFSAADRIIGRLHAEIIYDDEKILADAHFSEFLDHVLEELTKTHEAIARQYFEG